MTHSLRIRRRTAPKGKTAAIVLLVLAAICVLIGGVGIYLGYGALSSLGKLATGLFGGDVPVLVPGSDKPVTITGGPGAIIVAARASDSVDGTSYTYPPAVRPTVTVTDASGNAIQSTNNNPSGQDQGPVPLPDGSQFYFVDAFEVGEGTFTVSATGDPTALRVKMMDKDDAEAMASAATSMLGGFGGTCCGCGGAVVFGLIGVILLFVGRKAPAA